MNELTTKEMKFCQADELIKSLHIMNNTELKFMFYALSKREISETKITTTFDDVVNHLKFEYGGKQTRTYKKAIESIIQKSVMLKCQSIDCLMLLRDMARMILYSFLER